MPVKRGARAGVLRAAAALIVLAALASCTADSDGKTPDGRAPDGTAPDESTHTKPSPKPSPKPSTSPSTSPKAVRLPPVHAGFDYQIGGSYPPPAGVRIVARDREAEPAPGLYNICYVNAFQAQPDERDDWPADLLLRDKKGRVVVDGDWDEALLDIGTPAKRQRVADRINEWIDGCADRGYDAVEPDNFDSFTRSRGLLSADDATAFIKLLSDHAHARGLAIGQKNTVELAGQRDRTGLDFAVAEECGEYDECGEYAEAFDDRVVVVEYTDNGLRKARSGFGDRLSIVRRDVLVSTPDSADYVRKTR
ncbi:endo alpha-1,4 polygalactosaminidase [Streptomyces sp. NBC_00878]|uniref:endo alpha-1,4 polygalactosaminidase n=1 Tax=Streptomyces sp. NBC_00878 TaxID=2975854 RepID=UPI0022591A71|nr:endo alpha-1,4 polygalactosaminidase [Streptomyces sp. NBC_00878]MCX4903154.1 endo alpha-1,4 polygalactosaminidase [Streptomyces sp. NBC_00878]